MTDKERKIRALWQECFHDDEQFVELLFSHLYHDENAIGFEQHGEWIATLQILPYRLTVGESLLNMGYISGAATHPEYRNRGWMCRLVHRSFEVMHDRQIPLSALIPAEPWLYDYYAKQGYTPVFFRIEHRYSSAHHFESKGFYRITLSQDELYCFFTKQMMRRPCCVQHSREAFEVICGDIALDGGEVLSLADESGQLSALSFVVSRGDEVVVKELLATTAEAEVAMLHEIQCSFPNLPICQYLPPEEKGGAIRQGMIRLVDVEKVLLVFAVNNPLLNVTIRVTDPLLLHNNGDFRLVGGECVRGVVAHPDYSVDVAELATLLFGGKAASALLDFPALTPYMSLMLD